MLECNPDEFRAHLAPLNLTETQEDEILYALWEILHHVIEVELGVSHIVPEHFNSTAKSADQGLPNMLSQYKHASKPTHN